MQSRLPRASTSYQNPIDVTRMRVVRAVHAEDWRKAPYDLSVDLRFPLTDNMSEIILAFIRVLPYSSHIPVYAVKTLTSDCRTENNCKIVQHTITVTEKEDLGGISLPS